MGRGVDSCGLSGSRVCTTRDVSVARLTESLFKVRLDSESNDEAQSQVNLFLKLLSFVYQRPEICPKQPPRMMDDRIDGWEVLPQDLTALEAAMADNDPISENLESIARRLIAIGEAQLALLDEQPDDLERTTRELQESRQKKANDIEQYCTAIAPHRKLPPELLSNIFKHAVDHIELPCRTNESIFILKQICRKWRDVFSQTLALWTNIHIDVTQDIEGIAKRLFAKSGDLPLSIELRNYHRLEQSFEVPRLYAERCKDLVIRGEAPAIERLFRPHPVASLSSLLSLTIVIDLRHEDTQTATPLPLLETAVNLRRLTLSVTSFEFCAIIGRLSLFNLTYLNFSKAFVDPLILLPAMSRCPSLVTCMIMLAPYSGTTRNETTILSSLRYLRVWLTFPNSYLWMISIIMPRLSHLTLDGCFPEPEAYQYTVSRSNDLEILEIETSNLTGLEPILRMTPTISQLWLHADSGEYTLPKSVLDGLVTGELLPQLSKLECTAHSVEGLEAYVDMIESRFQAQSTTVNITEVKFFNWGGRGMAKSLLPRLKSLQEGGLIVRFSIVDESPFHSKKLFEFI